MAINKNLTIGAIQEDDCVCNIGNDAKTGSYDATILGNVSSVQDSWPGLSCPLNDQEKIYLTCNPCKCCTENADGSLVAFLVMGFIILALIVAVVHLYLKVKILENQPNKKGEKDTANNEPQ